MHSGGVALDGDCREGGTFAFSAIRLKLAFLRSPTAPLSSTTVFFTTMISEDHMTLKTGVMAAENSAVPSQE